VALSFPLFSYLHLYESLILLFGGRRRRVCTPRPWQGLRAGRPPCRASLTPRFEGGPNITPIRRQRQRGQRRRSAMRA